MSSNSLSINATNYTPNDVLISDVNPARSSAETIFSKGTVETALSSVASFALDNYGSNFSENKKQKLKELQNRNLTRNQIEYGIKFIQDIRNIKNGGFVIVVSDKKFDKELGSSDRITKEVDINKIRMFDLELEDIQIKNMKNTGKKIIILSNKVWDKINNFYEEFEQYRPPRIQSSDNKMISIGDTMPPERPPSPPKKKPSNVYFIETSLPNEPPESQPLLPERRVSIINHKRIKCLSCCLFCFVASGFSGLVTYALLGD